MHDGKTAANQDLGAWARDVRGVTPLGYVGDPASYDAKEGEVYMKAVSKMAAEATEAFLNNK